jgi:hypothetical protein
MGHPVVAAARSDAREFRRGTGVAAGETERLMNAPALRKFVRRLTNAARRTAVRVHDVFFDSYAASASFAQPLARLIPAGTWPAISAADSRAAMLHAGHRFDLLGSGWVHVRHGMRCRGFDGANYPPLDRPAARINVANRARSAGLRALISKDYRAIDWQLDFRSGFRWSESCWYRDIRYGNVPGADVKVPWELSRLQHLPEMALAYAAAPVASLQREFVDQVLDWIAHNPPRWGVNWACTMDVGIRVANLLIAFDLMRAAGAKFDAGFEPIFAASVRAHAAHIVRNLEWTETRRANHYLGNIAGLACAAAYLPADSGTDAWLLFAIQELAAETDRQFLADGGHFEASTSYHRLCMEMLAVSAAFVAALPKERIRAALARPNLRVRHGARLEPRDVRVLGARFEATGDLLPAAFHGKLRRAAQFTRDVMRADGSVPLVGDDDSGRFLRLGGWIDGGSVAECRARYANLEDFDGLEDDERYPVQPDDNHLQTLAWPAALYGCPDLLPAEISPVWANSLAIGCALRPAPIPVASPEPAAIPAATGGSQAPSTGSVTVNGDHRAPGVNLLAGARYFSYPHFGIYVLRSPRLHLAVRCGNAMQDGAGVHAHDDQLSIDLTIDGVAVTRDPGTFVYTASPGLRRAYRSAAAHAGPSAAGAAASPVQGLFGPPRQRSAQCMRFGDGSFAGVAQIPGGTVVREISVHADRLSIVDTYTLRDGWRPAVSDPFSSAQPVAFSPGYGVRMAVSRS